MNPHPTNSYGKLGNAIREARKACELSIEDLANVFNQGVKTEHTCITYIMKQRMSEGKFQALETAGKISATMDALFIADRLEKIFEALGTAVSLSPLAEEGLRIQHSRKNSFIGGSGYRPTLGR